jgi:hypothetical protein
VAAALVAVLALRTLLSDSLPAMRLDTAAPWIVIGVAFGTGLMLREVGRGLAPQVPRPRWSASFLGTWAGGSGLLLTVLLASGGSLGSGAWTSVALAVCLGVVLAASLHGARRLLRALTRLGARAPRRRTTAVSIPSASTLPALAPAPLLAGWSDRGPPSSLS